jgi:hypothetical protein
MNAQQYPGTMQRPPPPYHNNMRANQPAQNYYRPAEERMVDFQQLVGRYESEWNKI